MDEWENPIGCISLYDIEDGAGFLGTWLGKPFHGKGYNAIAKDAFFKELFSSSVWKQYSCVFAKNIRSIKAAEKLPYAVNANETRKSLYDQINHEGDIFDLYEIPKDLYTFHILRQHDDDEQQLLEA